eukprot:15442416-Alexandrium_andersonii.AAC.1
MGSRQRAAEQGRQEHNSAYTLALAAPSARCLGKRNLKEQEPLQAARGTRRAHVDARVQGSRR